MGRPYALLRAGFPYVKTLGMRFVIDFPVDMAIGKDGVLYALCRYKVDGDFLVRKVTYEDEDLGTIGTLGTGDGRCLWPAGIVLDHEDNLYISDEAFHQIAMFSKDGEFLGKWGEEGDGDGQLNRPSGLAFDADENIYIVDTLNHRVQKFTRDGKFLIKWGASGSGEGQFNMPWGITIDELSDIYVADWRNDRIQKFTADGEFIFQLGASGGGDGEFKRPTSVAVDQDGDIYVADCGNNRVQLFSAEGRYVQKFTGDATLSQMGRRYMMANALPLRLREMVNLEPQKLFRSPKSVKLDDQGRLFVAEEECYRIQVYQKDVIRLEPHQIVPPLRSPRLATT